MKPLLLGLFLLAMTPLAPTAPADADDAAVQTQPAFNTMSLQELKAINAKKLGKADQKAYKTALKAAEKAEKERQKAEKKRLQEKAEAQRFYEKQERIRLGKIAKSYDETSWSKSPYQKSLVATGRVVSISGYDPIIYAALQSTYGPDGEHHFVRISVSYAVTRAPDDYRYFKLQPKHWREYEHGTFYGGDPITIDERKRTYSDCNENGCRLTETIWIDLSKVRLVEGIRASYGVDLRLLDAYGTAKLVNISPQTVAGYIRKLHDGLGFFADEMAAYPELHEPLPSR